MSAKPVIEEAEQVKGGAPITAQSNLVTIVCEAMVLHQSEEDNLHRHIEKIREPGEQVLYAPQKRKALTKHIVRTAGITSMILFIVIMAHESLLIRKPLIRSLGSNYSIPY
jgi:hypothetical protein